MPVYKDEKTNTWYFSCYYKDWQGQQRRKLKRGFALQREAKEAEQIFLSQYAAQCDMTFAAMYDIYMADFKARSKKPSTVATKEGHFTSAILPYFGNIKLSDITPAHVRDWQNKIIQQYAPTTQKQLHGQLSALFNFAMKFYGLKQNPARLAGSIGEFKADTADFWTVEEFNAAMEYTPEPFRTAFFLFFYSGLRRGELLALNIGDFDAASNTITVNKSLERIKGVNHIGEPKNKQSIRTVTIPSSVADMLNQYIKTIYEPSPNEPLWPTMSGDHLAYRLEQSALKAGVKKIRLHDLRHSHAALLIEMDVNILAISKRLGHKDIKTTLNIYGHLYKEHAEQIAQKLDDYIISVSKQYQSKAKDTETPA